MSCCCGVLGRSSIVPVIASVTIRITRCGCNGCRPTPLHAEVMFWVDNASALAFIYAVNHSTFCMRVSCASLRWESALMRCFLSGLKTATLSGCNTCEVCDGSIRSDMRFYIQCDIKLPLIWLLWPLQIRRRCCFPPSAFARVAGLKTRFNHSTPCKLLVHPFVFAEKYHVFMTSCGI